MQKLQEEVDYKVSAIKQVEEEVFLNKNIFFLNL